MLNSNMKVLLLHPRPTPGTSCTVPYSCLAVAAPLIQNDYDVQILDEFSAQDYSSELRKAALQADIVGISCFTGHQIDSARASAQLLREQFPDLPLVWGGYHPSLYPQSTLGSGLADFVIKGQGEWIFLDMVERLSKNAAPEDTPGLMRIVDGKAQQNPGHSAFRDLENYPDYPYHLVDLKAFLLDSLTPRSISYHSSIGCPFRCNFCTVTEIYNRRWSGFPADRVLRDVKFLLRETGAKSVEFYDNNFFVNDHRTESIAKAFVDNELNILWSAEARPDKIAEYDSTMMHLLAQSGLSWVFIGAESGHDEVLELMERDHKAADIIKAAEKLAQHRIKATFSFNLGYPGEPADNFSETEKLAKELRRINDETELMIYITTAYESTPAFHKVAESNATTNELENWQHLDQRQGAKKSWLSQAYSQKLYNYSIVTFYATSFLHRNLRKKHRKNAFLKLLHLFAFLHLSLKIYHTILDLRILNRLFFMTSRSKRKKMDMWSGRS